MKRRSLLVAVLAVAFVIAAALAVAGQTRAVGPASVIAVLAGRVELTHGTAPFAQARDGDAIFGGDRVRTGADGHAVVTFFDGSTLDIASATEVAIEAAAAHDGAIDLVIAQAVGRTFSSVHKLVDPRSRYEIRTPSLTAAVRGTKFEVEVAPDGSAAERTTEGLVAVSSAGSQVLVPAGAGTSTTPGAPPASPVPFLAPPSAPTPGAQVAPAATNPVGSALPAAATPAPAIRAEPTGAPVGPDPAKATPMASTVVVPTASTAVILAGPLPTASPAPLPSASLAPLLTPSLAPLPSPSLAPLPLASLTPPPTASLAPVLSPTTTVTPPSIALPISTLP